MKIAAVIATVLAFSATPGMACPFNAQAVAPVDGQQASAGTGVSVSQPEQTLLVARDNARMTKPAADTK